MAARLEEGDPVVFEVTREGILLRRGEPTDPSQGWFWDPEWQAGEFEADAEVAAGQGEVHSSTEELLAALDRREGAYET